MNNNNNTIVDLNKVISAELFYWNQYGHTRTAKPKFPTLWGTKVDLNEKAGHLDSHPNETMGKRLKRRNQPLDKWTSLLILTVQSNHTLRYEGTKALSLWKAWKAKQFGGKK